MDEATVILDSVDDDLIGQIKEVLRPISGLRLEVNRPSLRPPWPAAREDVALCIVHVSDDDGDGLGPWLKAAGRSAPPAPVLVIGDRYDSGKAVAWLKSGAMEFLARPLATSRLAYLVEMLTSRVRQSTARPVMAELAGSQPCGSALEDQATRCSPSTPMGKLMDQVRRVARRDATILLGGETGTGKTRLAGLIHQLSNRRKHPFLTINCGALSSNLIESEMFGHVKGAFTGADAARIGKFAAVGQGTLFLDEVDSLPPALQAKLLRAVEERLFEPVGSNKTQPMQARLIAACNVPLENEVAANRFRIDLFYRLNVVSLTVPPLRDRREDIKDLARGFVAEFASRSDFAVHGISDEALDSLEADDWVGNIRDLRNVIERAVVLSPGPIIQIDDLPDRFVAQAEITTHPTSISLAASKADAERTRIVEAMARQGNNRNRVASELGISRMTLYKKLNKYGINA